MNNLAKGWINPNQIIVNFLKYNLPESNVVTMKGHTFGNELIKGVSLFLTRVITDRKPWKKLKRTEGISTTALKKII